MSESATKRAMTATADRREHISSRHRHDRLWRWANGLFFGSLMVWFFGFVLGLSRLISPYL